MSFWRYLTDLLEKSLLVQQGGERSTRYFFRCENL